MKKRLKPATKVMKFNPKKAYQSYTDKLQSELEEQGVEFFRPVEIGGTLNINSECLTLPHDIALIVNHELGNYLNAFTQQKMYMRTLLGWAECYMDEAKRNYFEASKELYNKLSSGSKLSETAKERSIVTDPEISPLYYIYQEYARKVSLLQGVIENIEDSIFLISREISRRSSDWSNENRNHNVGR